MAVRLLAEEASGGLQMMNDVWRCVQNRPTSVIAEPFDVSTRLVNGRNHPQPVEPSEFERGSWRHRVKTNRICVVVVLLSETEAVVVTTWRIR